MKSRPKRGDSPGSQDETLVELTLATVGEGELEEQFQEALARAVEILTDPSRFPAKAKAIGVEITPPRCAWSATSRRASTASRPPASA